MASENKVPFQILSDLHLEFGSGYDTFEIPPRAPYLCLLGDIGLCKDTKLFEFLSRQVAKFKIVFFLLGNHEAYSSSYPAAKKHVLEFQKKCVETRRQIGPEAIGEFVFLDQGRYDIADSQVTVLGCTLFSHVTPEQYEHVSYRLNDFYRIVDWTVNSHNAAHKADVEWLENELEKIRTESPERQVVIFSHHSPTMLSETIDPRHKDSTISSGFCTDLVPGKLKLAEQVKLWASGHTHFNFDVTVERIRLYSNQRGYVFEAHALERHFDVEAVVCI